MLYMSPKEEESLSDPGPHLIANLHGIQFKYLGPDQDILVPKMQ